VKLIFTIVRLAFALALLVFAWDWRAPDFVAWRAWIFAGLIGGASALVVLELALRRGLRKQTRLVRIASLLALATAVLALLTVSLLEAPFQWMRYRVLHADPALLEKLGRHMVVGYRDFAELRDLVERRAVGGVFIAPRNVQGRSAAEIRGEIDALQEIRRRQGLPPLWIAADQEGGIVSRMSPPLVSQPRISTVAAHVDQAERRRAVRDYAATQGEGLASLGINLNFAPVVDLDFQVNDPNDRYTRISDRAISRDPQIVSEVAQEYCLALAQFDVRCTLKHFPGLGRVVGDTHLDAAELKTSPDELGRSDWLPFRAAMRHANTFTMLSHVHLTALDPDRPVSFSRAVVAGLIRDQWKHDGVLVTDDLSMKAAYRSRDGLAGGTVEALNAGVDLILISYDWSQYFPVMHALLAAERDGRLQQTALAKSDARLWLTRPGSR
jgi:beta-N-acetylhexosaminidase